MWLPTQNFHHNKRGNWRRETAEMKYDTEHTMKLK